MVVKLAWSMTNPELSCSFLRLSMKIWHNDWATCHSYISAPKRFIIYCNFPSDEEKSLKESFLWQVVFKFNYINDHSTFFNIYLVFTIQWRLYLSGILRWKFIVKEKETDSALLKQFSWRGKAIWELSKHHHEQVSCCY